MHVQTIGNYRLMHEYEKVCKGYVLRALPSMRVHVDIYRVYTVTLVEWE